MRSRYTIERAHTSPYAELTDDGTDTGHIRLNLSDGLSDDFYDQPLTITITTPPDWTDKRIAIYQNSQIIKTALVRDGKATVSLTPTETSYQLKLMGDTIKSGF